MVQRTGAAYKVQAGVLSETTLDRAQNAITYRVFGCEKKRQLAYEENLTAYEQSAVKANIWNASMPPIYRIISMASVLFILYFGQKNVIGTGWHPWTIASFTTFLACFVKLAVKSSSAAKLFNAVHKAQVSWKRIRPLMQQRKEQSERTVCPPADLQVRHLNFAYPEGRKVLEDVSFEAKPGEIIGITGSVACGKSTLGKVFLCEYPYEGEVLFGGKELQKQSASERTGIISYLGHDPELFNDSIAANVLMGDHADAAYFLQMVCLDEEVNEMDEGLNTLVGNGGIRLSGGQAQRLALARTLCHKKPVLILDDPFSALDKNTEKKIFANLRQMTKDTVVLLISHRLYLFPETDQVLWMENGRTISGKHQELLERVPEYKVLFEAQTEDRNRSDAGAHTDEKVHSDKNACEIEQAIQKAGADNDTK